jgi:hypothetical protein
MRFSIRELFWLTAIVALAATVFTDRQLTRRREAKWQEEKAKIEEAASVAVAAAQRRLLPLRHENALLRRQEILQMERMSELERKLEEGQFETHHRALIRFPSPASPPR